MLRILQLIFIITCSPNQAWSQAPYLQKQIEKILEYEAPVDFNLVPGILVGVIDIDSTYRFVFGREISNDGIYEIGSVTKPIVAWLTNEALKHLELERNTQVCKFIPDSLCRGNWNKLTFEEVIEHRTGLKRLVPWMDTINPEMQDPFRDYSLSHLASDLNKMKPTPGKYSYSHLGYALMNWLFERVGGLNSFTSEYLTYPYSMKDTKWDVNQDDIAPGYGFDRKPEKPWNTNALMPAIGLKSSLMDLMSFLQILFEQYKDMPELQNTKALKKEIKHLAKSDEYKVINGWFVIRMGKSLVFFHSGRTGGHSVSVAFIPQMRKGVVVISNGALGSNELSLLILRMLRDSRVIKSET